MHARTFAVLFYLIPVALAAGSQEPVALWPEVPPGALGAEAKDIPTLTPFLPDPVQATGAAIVVCPGGGYNVLVDYEGRDYALWLNSHGIAAFVLKYRLASDGYHHPSMLLDAARGLRTVRARASEWNVDPKRIGIIGSSAGGHLASLLLTHFDAGTPDAADPIERVSSRPDLGILCYAVISAGQFAHKGSIRNAAGPGADDVLLEELSNEKHVSADTPPCFIWHTYDDKVVPVENSLMFAEALRRNGVPFDLHIYQHGKHGVALGDKPPFEHTHPWTGDLLFWLKARGFTR
jgi:acetyl esterase/lipase